MSANRSDANFGPSLDCYRNVLHSQRMCLCDVTEAHVVNEKGWIGKILLLT
jgi:hypothetical protein